MGRRWRLRRLVLGVVMALGLPRAVQANPEPAGPLHRLAQDELRGLREDEAIQELRRRPPQALALGEALQRLEREQVMEATLKRHSQAADVEPPSATPGHPGASPNEPLSANMRLPGGGGSPFGFTPTHTPPEKSRPEILEAGKRAGFQKLYKEGIGFQPVPWLGLSARTEIFEEPNPVDDFILEAKILNFSEISQFRRSIMPLFTRSAAGRVVLDQEPFPRLTYEYDARETLHEFQTRFGFKDIDRQTHAVNALYSFPRVPLVGLLTVNPWYKRVLQSSDHDLGSYEHRDELIANLSLQQTEHIEYFFQLDMYDTAKTRTLGGSKLKLFKGQVRLRVPPLRLFAIPSFEYSDTTFDPSDDEFIKRDLFVDWGFDITPRLRASSKQQVVLTELTQAGKEPSNPTTQVFNWTNTLSYELFKDFDVSLGVDHAHGAGYGNYNNVGIRTEAELFKPGFIRSKLGWEWLSYYNISEDEWLLYWKFFLFQ